MRYLEFTRRVGELRERKKQLREEGHSIVNRAQAEGRNTLTDLEGRHFDLLVEDLDEIQAELKRLEREGPDEHPAPTRTTERPPSPGELQVMLSSAGAERVRATALHEAGHGVAFTIGGAGVAEIALRFGRDSSGNLEILGGYCKPRDFERLNRTCHLAGIAAVGLAKLDEAIRSEWVKGDEWRAEQSGSDLYRRRNDLECARGLLAANWPAVRAVAQALMERGELDGAQAERIIVSNLDPAIRWRLGSAA